VNDANKLRWSLRELGLSNSAINAAWPQWWSTAAEASSSAQTELRFSLSRKLGLDPRSLLDDAPRFIWRDEAKFKRLTAETDAEQAALISFGASVGRSLIAATTAVDFSLGPDPERYRHAILKDARYVGLHELLAFSWGVGIPVAYLRVFPLNAKKMTAMVVRAKGRFAILLAHDASYPAPVAFYLAHELGHAALGHVRDHVGVVELGDSLMDGAGTDQEELQADKFALHLLTGKPAPNIVASGSGFNAPAIANAVLQSSSELRIEPGVMALCFAHTSGAWQQAFAALSMIYPSAAPVWMQVNSVAFSQLDWQHLDDDTAIFLKSVLGEADLGPGGPRQ
jgi:hypothetical protein